MAVTSVTTSVSGGTVFSVPFDYLKPADVVAYMLDNGSLVDLGTYTVTTDNQIIFDTAVPAGDLTIARQTDIDTPTNRFAGTADFTGQRLDDSDDQARYKLQEQENLLASVTSDGTGSLPASQVSTDFLIGVGDGTWARSTLANAKSVLGITASAIPTPSAQEDYFLKVDGSDSYQLVGPGVVRDAIGVPAISSPTGNNQFLLSSWVTAAGEFRWLGATAGTARSAMGLKTAAVRDTGDDVGQVPLVLGGQQLSGNLNVDNCKVAGTDLATTLAALSSSTVQVASGTFASPLVGGGNTDVNVGFQPDAVLVLISGGDWDDKNMAIMTASGTMDLTDQTADPAYQMTVTIDATGFLASTARTNGLSGTDAGLTIAYIAFKF